MEYSKSLYNYKKRIDADRFESFQAYKKRREDEALMEQQKNKKIMEDYSDLANLKKNRERARLQEANRKMEYDEKVNVIGLTEALTAIVKKSLLLDIDEYAKLNENYEETIRSTIKDFLTKGNINENITNPNTLAIIESINAAKPKQEVGIYLNESELSTAYHYFNKPEAKLDVDNDAIGEYGAPSYNTCTKEIENLSCNVMDKVASQIDKDSRSAEEVDAQLNAIAMTESKLLIRNDKPNRSVLEVLALNEAKEMIQEKKEYNSDLALANAITYITILETLDATGLITVGTEGYKAILEAAGEYDNKRVAKSSHAINLLEEKDEQEIKEKVSLYESQVSSARHAGFKSFDDWKAERKTISLNENAAPVVQETYDYIDRNGKKVMLEDVRREAEQKGYNLQKDSFPFICRVLGYTKL